MGLIPSLRILLIFVNIWGVQPAAPQTQKGKLRSGLLWIALMQAIREVSFLFLLFSRVSFAVCHCGLVLWLEGQMSFRNLCMTRK